VFDLPSIADLGRRVHRHFRPRARAK
jgi:hypothetical protein